MKNEWFSSWFDTSYYHILYQNRDETEAKTFIENLIEELSIPKGSTVLDLACGKGRHSLTLNELGFQVLGVDLSENSIRVANEYANKTLSFAVHDMRRVIVGKTFTAIFNFFTSFGYFDDEIDNVHVLESVHAMLESNGLFVLDFMNANQVIQTLVPSESKKIDGIQFNIKRKYDGKHIVKEIEFQDQGNEFHFEERVQALTYEKFESLLTLTGFKILRTFGDFDLSPYDKLKSSRLIIIAQKV